MKDEIKEILDKLQKVANRETASRNALMEMKDKDYQLLLDYITNLQKENEKYKKIFEGKERFSKIMPDDTDFIILSKADYDRQQEDIELELIDYKSRNEKAIERLNNIIDELEKYIEENIKITKQALKFEGLDDFDKKKYSRDIRLFEMILDKLQELKEKSDKE